MKKLKFIYLFVAFSMLTTLSCEDILDVEASDAFAEDLIYSDPVQVERLVYTVYNSTESWGINKAQWWSRRFNIEAGSFEAKFNFKNLDLFRLRAGWTDSNAGILNEKWRNYWDYIRLANEFLDRIDESEAMQKDPEHVAILKAEMRFLRANAYSKLLKYYGGVPILERALGLDDNFQLVRNSYEECVTFIVNELDEAAAVLPESRPDVEFGRATKLAALAVKSRTLLYAASKLHDPSTAPNGPLYDYAKASKWQDAADAAKAVIDMVGARDLIAVSDATDYQNLFLAPNEDILFARPFSAAYYDFGTDVNSLWDQTQSPSGYGGWGLSSPTHNFALQFNMADGTRTDAAGSIYDPANPNANREMRYYADLNYQGAQFRGRTVDYALADTPSATTPDGPDSPNGIVEGIGVNQEHSSKTGYNIRKFQDESLTAPTDIAAQRPFILYRLAEIYLNYAEAQAELGNDDSARIFVNKISSRALQPAITAAGEELKEAIKRERRIELAFEGHNFFDERRWMNEEHLGFPIQGLTWTKAPDGTLSNTEYTVVTRPWFQKHYYLPIPATEVEKAPSLLQNSGY
ncbi:RagB/SusD family nutrient uptake outer membrane protein [Cellulophaga baltica]|uniref:Starch-binding associating with outer membrane n=1 Tax=Cellulophaga baltica TaxID=76594 RepID=A0A1G7E1Y1_9FLAO|nr:RagB/SusD family nutrient uptake outer membrane protein [Cellulophaga baltica]AIY15188.1 carbohydrate-binding protein SusD [Cellulophaga baltica NN016038]MBA6314477.1 RagB/SusD family nutrient uptake outer membrane protein [Cellulophaga baltica]SDE57671.1 Starch-binding associating with outer membrane [Cellulophaga baltica]